MTNEPDFTQMARDVAQELEHLERRQTYVEATTMNSRWHYSAIGDNELEQWPAYDRNFWAAWKLHEAIVAMGVRLEVTPFSHRDYVYYRIKDGWSGEVIASASNIDPMKAQLAVVHTYLKERAT